MCCTVPPPDIVALFCVGALVMYAFNKCSNAPRHQSVTSSFACAGPAAQSTTCETAPLSLLPLYHRDAVVQVGPQIRRSCHAHTRPSIGCACRVSHITHLTSKFTPLSCHTSHVTCHVTRHTSLSPLETSFIAQPAARSRCDKRRCGWPPSAASASSCCCRWPAAQHTNACH